MNHLTSANISSTARKAIKILGQHSDTTQTTAVSQQSYTLVRNFLFTQIFIDNTNRPGVLAGMTIEEYNRMRKQDEHYVITVMRHKTAHVHGPARIVLNEKLKSWLLVFVEVMQPQLASATTGNVFLTRNGKAMESSHIIKLGKLMREDASETEGKKQKDVGEIQSNDEKDKTSPQGKKVAWNKDLEKIKKAFEGEINLKEITLDQVCDRIESSFKFLQDLLPAHANIEAMNTKSTVVPFPVCL
jgi:hypothetical protein